MAKVNFETGAAPEGLDSGAWSREDAPKTAGLVVRTPAVPTVWRGGLIVENNFPKGINK